MIWFAPVIGAAAGFDRTAFGQTLLAHPVIAALIATAVASDANAAPAFALSVGLLSASALPVGEQGPRDWTSAAVAMPFAVGPGASDARWGAGLLLSCFVAWAGGRAIDAVRAIARRRWRAASGAIEAGDLDHLERLHLGLSLLHLVRGALVVGTAAGVGRVLLDGLDPRLPVPEAGLLALVWRVAPWVGLPVLLRFHLALAPWPWVLTGGAAAGIVWFAAAWP